MYACMSVCVHAWMCLCMHDDTLHSAIIDSTIMRFDTIM